MDNARIIPVLNEVADDKRNFLSKVIKVFLLYILKDKLLFWDKEF